MIRVKDVYKALDCSPGETWGTISIKNDTVTVNVWGQGGGNSFSFPDGRGVIWAGEYLFHTHPRGHTCQPSPTDMSNAHIPHDYMWIFGEDGAVFFSTDPEKTTLFYSPNDVLASRLSITMPDGQKIEKGKTKQTGWLGSLLARLARMF